MDDLYKPIDFSAISGYPHLIPEKAIENLPCFQSNNIVNARRHVQRVSHCFNKWCCNTLYEDVGMKLFILSLMMMILIGLQNLRINRLELTKS
jgi:hypothetical protein